MKMKAWHCLLGALAAMALLWTAAAAPRARVNLADRPLETIAQAQQPPLGRGVRVHVQAFVAGRRVTLHDDSGEIRAYVRRLRGDQREALMGEVEVGGFVRDRKGRLELVVLEVSR